MLNLVLLCLFLTQYAKSCDEEPLVETNVGTIKGLKSDDCEYYMYLGVPYGQIDYYYNAFGEALPYPPFEEVFEAYDGDTLCPQVNEDNNNTIQGSLDCLRLNIYVPKSANSANPTLPVMVWLYGGGFRYGHAGAFKPNHLVKHDVIIVTLNYRTGPYGFMSVGTADAPGNQGLKDQYLAFKWIKNNIGAFGGNPDLITAFGQSAGGHSIDLHLRSPRETLFNKAILESGSAESLTVLYEPDRIAPLKLARYLDFKTDDIETALCFLSNTTTDLVIAATKALNIQFKPCVETLFANVEAFIDKTWINSEVPKVRNVPVLMGFNKLELASKDFPLDIEYFKNSSLIKDHLKQVFDFNDTMLNEMAVLVSHFYYGDAEISEKVKFDLIRFDSDITYIHPVHRTLRYFLDSGAGNIYFYMFSYVGGRNALVTKTDEDKCCKPELCCASHVDEVNYLFDKPNKPKPTATDRIVIQRMTTMWTNFAKFSDPTPAISQLLPVTWIPVTYSTYNYLDIDTELTLGKRPLYSRMAFWDTFYRLNKQYEKLFEPMKCD